MKVIQLLVVKVKPSVVIHWYSRIIYMYGSDLCIGDSLSVHAIQCTRRLYVMCVITDKGQGHVLLYWSYARLGSVVHWKGWGNAIFIWQNQKKNGSIKVYSIPKYEVNTQPV